MASSASDALRHAEAEELTRLRIESNISGYMGVVFHSSRLKPYQAKVKRGGETVSLGTFTTAEEAALCYARSPEAQVAVAAAAAPPPPPPMTAEEALRQAEAEGLTLQKSESSNTGYKGVNFKSDRRMPYLVKVKRGGKTVRLGSFLTAEEAALCYARSPEAQAVAVALLEPPPMTAEEALRQAEAEGLTLVRSSGSNTGYKGVRFVSGYQHGSKSKPYQAAVWRGKAVTLGTFATAEEAALCYARTPEARAAVAAAAAPPKPPPMTAEEALRQAEAEGLTLIKSEMNTSGYWGVANDSRSKTTPYLARVKRGGKDVQLAIFATAEEAALCVARTPEAQATVSAAAAPPAPPPMPAEEALRQAEVEGLTLIRAEGSSSTDYKGVGFRSGKMHTISPYKANVRRDGKQAHVGYFATAEEAALVLARTPEARAQVADEAGHEAHFDVVEGILFASAPSSNGKRQRVK